MGLQSKKVDLLRKNNMDPQQSCSHSPYCEEDVCRCREWEQEQLTKESKDFFEKLVAETKEMTPNDAAVHIWVKAQEVMQFVAYQKFYEMVLKVKEGTQTIDILTEALEKIIDETPQKGEKA